MVRGPSTHNVERWPATASSSAAPASTISRTSTSRSPATSSSSSPGCPARASRRWRSTPSTPRGSGATSSRCRPTPGSSSSRWRSPRSTPSRACRRPSRSSRRPPRRTRARPSAPSPRSTTTCACCSRASASRTVPSCGRVISAQTVQQMVDRVLTLPAGTRLLVLAPVIRGRKGEYKKLFFDLQRQGYSRVRVNGIDPRARRGHRPRQEPQAHDRGRRRPPHRPRQPRPPPRRLPGNRPPPRRRHRPSRTPRRANADGSTEAGRQESRRRSTVPDSSTARRDITRTGGSGGSGTRPPAKQSRAPPICTISQTLGARPREPMVFSERLACAECGISFPEVSPRMFSFNNPYGACPECGGIGTRWEIDPERLVPNPARSLTGRGAGAVGGRASRPTSGRRWPRWPSATSSRSTSRGRSSARARAT